MSDEKDQQNSPHSVDEGPASQQEAIDGSVDGNPTAHSPSDEAAGTAAEDAQALDDDEAESQEAQLREALLRTRAEMDNLEKRTQREMEKARKFMFERVFKDLLPVIDSLDQGLEATGGDVDGDEGLALTRKLLMQTLERHGLEAIEPMGEPFDPQWHEAMSAQPSDEHPAQTVLMVMQKGYRLNERLLRPARVIISAEPE